MSINDKANPLTGIGLQTVDNVGGLIACSKTRKTRSRTAKEGAYLAISNRILQAMATM